MQFESIHVSIRLLLKGVKYAILLPDTWRKNSEILLLFQNYFLKKKLDFPNCIVSLFYTHRLLFTYKS